jgi:hypothetical protein
MPAWSRFGIPITPGPLQPFYFWANLVTIYLIYALLIFATVMIVHSLCNMASKRLNLGTGAKVWFGIVLALNIIVAIFLLISGWQEIINILIIMLALIGTILMLTGQRAGWYIYVFGITLNIAFSVNFALMSVWAKVSYEVLLPSLIFLVNPLISWLLIRKKWGELDDAALI